MGLGDGCYEADVIEQMELEHAEAEAIGAKVYRRKSRVTAIQLTAEHFEAYRVHGRPLPLGAKLSDAYYDPNGKCKSGRVSLSPGSACAEIGDFIVQDERGYTVAVSAERFLSDYEVEVTPRC
jgi:hypothetical protein